MLNGKGKFMYHGRLIKTLITAGITRTRLILIVICAVFCNSAGAQVIAIGDDFDDNEIDIDIWRNLDDDPIGENSPYRYPVEQNQRLEIINDGTQDDTAGLRTQLNLPADGYFQVQVAFNASDCTEQSAVFLSVHNFTTDYDHAVQYAMIGNGVVEGRRWFVIHSAGEGDEEPVWAVEEATETGSGTFYITYEAGIIHLSYTGFGQENALHTTDISEWTGCEQVWIALTAWSNGADLTGSGSYFDDFFLSTSIAPPEENIEETIVFLDESVEAGELEGQGPGQSADNRLTALRNMLENAAVLIEGGFYAEACDQLWSAYGKCDGDSKPPDFVTGDAADELADMIVGVIYELGCE